MHFNPWLGRSPGEGDGKPLQYFCLENPTDGGTWWATVHGVTKSRTPLSDFTFTFTFIALLFLFLLPTFIYPSINTSNYRHFWVMILIKWREGIVLITLN